MFDITKIIPPYSPQEVDSITQDTLPVLYIKQDAFNQMCTHIGFGEETLHNQVEQGGFLLGEVLMFQQKHIVIVHSVIPAYTAEGSMRHLHFDHHTWHTLLESQDKLTIYPKQLIGWYHTHPKHLKVYFSDTDKQNHQCFFGQDWHVGLVINPQQKKMKCFLGNIFDEIPIQIITN